MVLIKSKQITTQVKMTRMTTCTDSNTFFFCSKNEKKKKTKYTDQVPHQLCQKPNNNQTNTKRRSPRIQNKTKTHSFYRRCFAAHFLSLTQNLQQNTTAPFPLFVASLPPSSNSLIPDYTNAHPFPYSLVTTKSSIMLNPADNPAVRDVVQLLTSRKKSNFNSTLVASGGAEEKICDVLSNTTGISEILVRDMSGDNRAVNDTTRAHLRPLLAKLGVGGKKKWSIGAEGSTTKTTSTSDVPFKGKRYVFVHHKTIGDPTRYARAEKEVRKRSADGWSIGKQVEIDGTVLFIPKTRKSNKQEVEPYAWEKPLKPTSAIADPMEAMMLMKTRAKLESEKTANYTSDSLSYQAEMVDLQIKLHLDHTAEIERSLTQKRAKVTKLYEKPHATSASPTGAGGQLHGDCDLGGSMRNTKRRGTSDTSSITPLPTEQDIAEEEEEGRNALVTEEMHEFLVIRVSGARHRDFAMCYSHMGHLRAL